MWYKKVNNLLSKGGNTKTDKNEYLTYNLSLAPYTLNDKGVNMCPMASQGCAAACLNETGRGVFSNVSQARINKTNYYVYDRINFLDQLSQEIIGVASGLRENGMSYHKIAEELTRRGIPTKTGNDKWIHTSVRRILTRPDGWRDSS